MKKIKIKSIDTLAQTPYVGLYDIEYSNKLGKVSNWAVSSRKGREELEKIYIEGKEDKADAVVIVAFHEESQSLVLINQFRIPINGYIYELPAGLIDQGEGIDEAIKRELKEETGLEVTTINKVKSADKLYLSPGMTDESVTFAYCSCKGQLSDEFLEEDEDIKAYLITREKAKKMFEKGDKVDIKAYLVLQMFIELGEKMFTL